MITELNMTNNGMVYVKDGEFCREDLCGYFDEVIDAIFREIKGVPVDSIDCYVIEYCSALKGLHLHKTTLKGWIKHGRSKKVQDKMDDRRDRWKCAAWMEMGRARSFSCPN